jgi:hypothetical protein
MKALGMGSRRRLGSLLAVAWAVIVVYCAGDAEPFAPGKWSPGKIG